MIKEVSQENGNLHFDENNLSDLKRFSVLAIKVLDESESGLRKLFDIIDSENMGKNQYQETQPNFIEDSLNRNCPQKQIVSQKQQMSQQQGPIQSPKFSELLKRKQFLMQKLKKIDRQLIQCKFQPRTCRNSQKKIKKQSDNLNYSYSNEQKLNPVKLPKKLIAIQTDYDRIQQMNRAKIKQHQELIKKMKIRQQQQIRKIRQIEQRRIKNFLNRQKSQLENKQNIKSLELPKIKKHLL